jgi:hypothetical protein
MKKWFKKIGIEIAWLFKERYAMADVTDVPDTFSELVIYIVGEPGTPWLIAFRCPCGCKSIIHLNLLEDVDPKWYYKINKKRRITIYPSVWRIRGCKSHFFVRAGKILWV